MLDVDLEKGVFQHSGGCGLKHFFLGQSAGRRPLAPPKRCVIAPFQVFYPKRTGVKQHGVLLLP